MRFTTLSLTLASALWTTTALAAATPEGAADLTAVFQTYLGTDAGVVTVTPNDDDYSVKLDFAPLLKKIPGAGPDATATPFELSLTDNEDGTWEVAYDQSVALDIKIPGVAEISAHAANMKGTGTFDAGLKAFTESTGEVTDMSLTEKITDPAGTTTDVAYHIDSGTMVSTGEAAEKGVDSTMSYGFSGISEVFTLPGMGEGAPATEISLTADSYVANGTIDGLQSEAIYKLIAFFVANPTEAAVTANQAGLKSVIGEGMPLFGHMLSTGTVTNITATTPMGPVTVAEAGIEVEANGLVADGLLREAFAIKGLGLPEGLVPPALATLVPTDVTLDFKVSRFNLEAPVKLFLDTVDFATGPADAPAFEAQLMAAALPEGVVDVTIAPSSVVAPDFTLGLEGAITAGPNMPMPVGKATVSLKGIEAVMAAMQASPPELGMADMAPMLAMAQAMAKPGDDGALLWELEATETGGMLVNGTDLMGAGQ